MGRKLGQAKLSDGGVNINVLTSARLADLGGGATFYATLVEVERVSKLPSHEGFRFFVTSKSVRRRGFRWCRPYRIIPFDLNLFEVVPISCYNQVRLAGILPRERRFCAKALSFLIAIICLASNIRVGPTGGGRGNYYSWQPPHSRRHHSRPHVYPAGDVYDQAALERDFNSLWNTGYFDDLRIEREPSPKGWIIHVYVKEKPTIREIKYVGLSSVSQSDVLDKFKERKVGLTQESQYDPTKVKHAEVVIKELLAAHGRQFATVTFGGAPHSSGIGGTDLRG